MELNTDILITRVFAASREVVFKAWTDPAQLAKWWGPRGFTNPTCELDVRPGGRIYVVMRAPNGTEYPMGGAFREVTPPERLVFTSSALDAEGKPLFEILHTITFAEEGGKTALTSVSRLLSTTPAAVRYLPGHKAGMTQSFERLAELLTGTAGVKSE